MPENISLTPEQAEHALVGVANDCHEHGDEFTLALVERGIYRDEATNETLRQLVRFVLTHNPSYFPQDR